MAKRSTIGTNPLDAVVPIGAPAQAPPATPTETQPAAVRRSRTEAVAPRTAPGGRNDKERLTVHVPVDLINRLKNAVYWTPGLTLAGLAEEAFDKALQSLEKDQGGPFPQRAQELRGGRPLK